jgi:hypothetical protein
MNNAESGAPGTSLLPDQIKELEQTADVWEKLAESTNEKDFLNSEVARKLRRFAISSYGTVLEQNPSIRQAAVQYIDGDLKTS